VDADSDALEVYKSPVCENPLKVAKANPARYQPWKQADTSGIICR